MSYYFIGYSSKAAKTSKSWVLYDVDLITQDLLNAFNCRPGERVMRPDYGCMIWTYFMEPFTEDLQNMIVNEAIRICNTDSRVQIVDVSVAKITKGITVAITLNYVPLNVIGTFQVNFEAAQDAYYGTGTQQGGQ